jgi:hypothetical protein
VGVGRHPAIGMPDQQQIAEPPQLVAGIGHDAVIRRDDRGAPRGADVDAVVMQAAGLGAEIRQDGAA